MNSTETSNIFDALGNSIRHSIFELLAHGSRSVGEIAAAMPVTRSAVSQHLKILKEAGLIRETQLGRHNVYAAVPASLDGLSEYIDRLRRCANSATPSQMPKRPYAASFMQTAREDVHDDIDAASESWAKIYPRIEPGTMAIVSRLLLVARIIAALLARVAAEHGMNSGEAMILGTLRRLGEPFQATPSELSKVSIVAPPGIAKRLDRLQKLGFVSRVSNPADRRSHRVRLTAKGIRVADSIARQNLEENYAAILELPRYEKEHLARALRYIRRNLQVVLG